MQTQLSNFHLRGLPGHLMLLLKQRAHEGHTSVNGVIIQVIERGLGVGQSLVKRREYDDIDALAGTWSPKDVRVFEENTQTLDEIDASLWK
jgi:hypothetical protein